LRQEGGSRCTHQETDNIYKTYGESFGGEDHLRIVEEAQAIVSDTLAAAPQPKEES
jgi:phosphoglucomutase